MRPRSRYYAGERGVGPVVKPSKVERYLSRRADLGRRPLVAGNLEGVDGVVVIPALAESATLPDTLRSLAAQPPELLATTLVICVINNRDAEYCEASERDDNRRTLAWLGEDGDGRKLRVVTIDAATAGKELAAKQGVGAARKIGMDWAVEVLRRSGGATPFIASLDADTLVDENYLPALYAHFAQARAWGAVIAYAHRFDGDAEQRAGIIAYECYLRYCTLGLRYAASPYAFHTIGSAMACSLDAYVAVSGMNQRRAGEDFYFLQELAKTGGVAPIHDTTVLPSSRASSRVPFGTGRSMNAFLEGGARVRHAYALETFDVLRDWLRILESTIGPEQCLAEAKSLSGALAEYLEQQGLVEAWGRLSRNARDHDALVAQRHRWFDAFRTLKYMHFLRDAGLSETPLFPSIAQLLEGMGHSGGGVAGADVEAQLRVLEGLRELR